MKRVFAMGLVVMLIISTQLLVPERPVPIDSDVGIQYVIQDDQDMIVMELTADYQCPVYKLQDVENSCDSDFILSANSLLHNDCYTQQLSATTDYGDPVTLKPDCFRGLGGLSPGSVFPRAGEMVRHT